MFGCDEPARELGLAHEPLHRHRIARVSRIDQLDRDLAIDRALPRAIDRAHPALAEPVADLEAAVDRLTDQLVDLAADLDEPAPTPRAGSLGTVTVEGVTALRAGPLHHPPRDET